MEINPSVTNFANVARLYCEWAERGPSDPHDEMRTAQVLLAELHSAVLKLPDDMPDTETPDDSFSAADWKKISGRFQHLPVKGYWHVFNPLEQEDPVFSTLWDDLSDIWRDLREGLVLYDNGHVAEAVWEWRFNFEIHWGRHLTAAQLAIHSYFS